MSRSRTVASVASAAVVLATAAYTIAVVSQGGDAETPVEHSLVARDLSKDEWLAHASPDVFHGTVLAMASQAHTDQPGEVEQRWRVRVDRAFKGGASGTVTVSTIAYVARDGSPTDEGGGVIPRPGRMYVFSGHRNGSDHVYYPFGGSAGTRPSPALNRPFGVKDGSQPLHPERFGGAETVEEYWTTAVKNAVSGPPLT
ncbi:hypothetical protein ACN2WE_35920 [Streptomyces sp. cg28]|uniref:hypothetical protein n=1 Tax=Streptomyces sp. cg28 TaxID=3403457 RepID=UPI003B2267E9